MTSPDFTHQGTFNRVASPTKPTTEASPSRASFAPGELPEGFDPNDKDPNRLRKVLIAAAGGVAILAAIVGGPKVVEALSPAPTTQENNQDSNDEGVAIELASPDPSPSEIPSALSTPEVVSVAPLNLNAARLADLPVLDVEDWTQDQIQAERDAAIKELITNNPEAMNLDFVPGPDNTAQQVLQTNFALEHLQNQITASGDKQSNIISAVEGITYGRFVENNENTGEIEALAETAWENWKSHDTTDSIVEAHFSADDITSKWIQYTVTKGDQTSTVWGNFAWSDAAGMWQNIESARSAPINLGALTEKWGQEVFPEN